MNNKLIKKIGIALILSACVCSSFSMGASAQETNTGPIAEKAVISVHDKEIQPRADVIEIKYRYYNGIHQYRRWNRTRSYWVDPYWVNVRPASNPVMGLLNK